jgi:alcohol dehydrogenase class IV
VHGFAAPFGGMFPAPHGATCARLLPYVMEANVRALQERQPGSQAFERYTEAAQILTGMSRASAEDGAAWVKELCSSLHVPPLSSYDLSEERFPELIDKASRASSMQGNPIPLTPGELRWILEQAF